MAAVAERAGVATGTAYVHYDSKDQLVIATYLEIKADLSAAAVAGMDEAMPPRDRFLHVWGNAYRHLAADPARARYLAQVEASPYSQRAHELAMERDDPLIAASARMAQDTVDLPVVVVWDLGFGPAIRLAANPQSTLGAAQLERLAEACWRAVSKSG